MDNITHSLTGVIAARIAERNDLPVADTGILRKTLFWLFLLTANLPDIDVALGFFVDPITALQHHRGITHSLLFAPVFALLPAWVFYRFGNVKEFRILWLAALTGILLHILFDLITPFGTQLFAPFVPTRYSLDWMFIIDPAFTGAVSLLLLLGKLVLSRRRMITTISALFVAAYLGIEWHTHRSAIARVEDYAAKNDIPARYVSAFPQPLSLFSKMGIIQTDEGAYVSFFSVRSDDTLHFDLYRNSDDAVTHTALATPEAKWYHTFARHPVYQSKGEGETTVVELRDLQFTMDQRLVRWLGMTERAEPFRMKFTYGEGDTLMGVEFNGKQLKWSSAKEGTR
jgi:inner membrane protein